MLSFETTLMLASDVVKLQGTPLNRGGNRGDGKDSLVALMSHLCIASLA